LINNIKKKTNYQDLTERFYLLYNSTVYYEEVAIMKTTFNPKKRQEKKEHGFMKRMKTRAGRNVLKAKKAKGRKKLTA